MGKRVVLLAWVQPPIEPCLSWILSGLHFLLNTPSSFNDSLVELRPRM